MDPKIVDDFGTGRRLVELPVGLRLELVSQKPSTFFSELGGLFDHPGSFSSRGAHNDLGTNHSHELAAFDTKRLGHGDDALVATLGAHHRQGDSGVSGGRLDDRVSGLELAFFFGRFDDREGQAVRYAR